MAETAAEDASPVPVIQIAPGTFISSVVVAFNALTLLDGHQEEHPVSKN